MRSLSVLVTTTRVEGSASVEAVRRCALVAILFVNLLSWKDLIFCYILQQLGILNEEGVATMWVVYLS